MSKYFTKDHEWVLVDGDTATVGITDHAQDQLGDIVFVDLPEVDEEYEKGDDISVVESVKAAGDIHNPVTGVVTAVNEQLEDDPNLVNTNAETDGWIYQITISDQTELGDLMNEIEYQDFINT